jgi:hypothetical protein
VIDVRYCYVLGKNAAFIRVVRCRSLEQEYCDHSDKIKDIGIYNLPYYLFHCHLLSGFSLTQICVPGANFGPQTAILQQ